MNKLKVWQELPQILLLKRQILMKNLKLSDKIDKILSKLWIHNILNWVQIKIINLIKDLWLLILNIDHNFLVVK